MPQPKRPRPKIMCFDSPAPSSPPCEPQEVPQTPWAYRARDAAPSPVPLSPQEPSEPSESSVAPSAPIRIKRPHVTATYYGRRDSLALESPQSVPMVRTISNALSSQPTSYAPSRYMSCEYSECGSFRPGLDGLLGAPLSRRISIEQPGRSRLHLLRDHINQNTRPPSTERKAQLDAWRSADMDPPNGAREDGTEHFAFLTDEELQAGRAAGSYNDLPQNAGSIDGFWFSGDLEL